MNAALNLRVPEAMDFVVPYQYVNNVLNEMRTTKWPLCALERKYQGLPQSVIGLIFFLLSCNTERKLGL